MKLVIFGLSLSSSWGNGHATTYRALLRAFAARGHAVTFYEWDAPWYRGAHRDLSEPDFCRLELYEDWECVRELAIAEAGEADAVIVGSYVRDGPTVIDELLAGLEGEGERLCFYDIDTPVTVAKLRRGEAESLRPDQIPRFARYLSFTGGPFLKRVLEDEFGARNARPLYCSVDTERYSEHPADPELRSDLAYMGTYSPDRTPGLNRLMLVPARRLPESDFLLAGSQYPETLEWPPNVRRLQHVRPARHAAFYSSAAWQLNLTRADMRDAGWSPSVRLFEAAACGAAILSDRWPGIEEYFVPGEEILLPESSEEVVEILSGDNAARRRRIGSAARERVHREHSSRRRAEELEAILSPGSDA